MSMYTLPRIFAVCLIGTFVIPAVADKAGIGPARVVADAFFEERTGVGPARSVASSDQAISGGGSTARVAFENANLEAFGNGVWTMRENVNEVYNSRVGTMGLVDFAVRTQDGIGSGTMPTAATEVGIGGGGLIVASTHDGGALKGSVDAVRFVGSDGNNVI